MVVETVSSLSTYGQFLLAADRSRPEGLGASEASCLILDKRPQLGTFVRSGTRAGERARSALVRRARECLVGWQW